MKRNAITLIFLSVALLALASISAFAYQINENTTMGSPSSIASTTDDTQNIDNSTTVDGPVRLARFSFIEGNVSWRANDTDTWSFATVNLPMRQGAEIWVTNGGRAEIQFDDGSLLRLGNGAIATLQTFYSDADGEFTEIKMNEGLSSLILKHTKSVFQIDTPIVAVKSSGPSNIRVGVDNSVEVAVRAGNASVQGNAGEVNLNAGEYLDLADSSSVYAPDRIPEPDSWDTWNDGRDNSLSNDEDTQSHVPSNVGLVAGDLSNYGTWRVDTQYGYVWSPYVNDNSWRPYEYGHWVWVEPFGWTWVSDEAWGWAPYHYGTWIHEDWGWAWVPGPVDQYWCPAVVNFSEYNGCVAWVALSPGEVRYPTALTFIQRNRGWSAFFSIGGAAVYYPSNSQYCEPRPWRNVVINRNTFVFNVNRTTEMNRNTYVNMHFVPRNSRFEGVITAPTNDFSGQAQYRPVVQGGDKFFSKGQNIGAPATGKRPFAGPIAPKPTVTATTSSNSFLKNARPDNEVAARPVFRATLPAEVSKVAPPVNSSKWNAAGTAKDRAMAARQSLSQFSNQSADTRQQNGQSVSGSSINRGNQQENSPFRQQNNTTQRNSYQAGNAAPQQQPQQNRSYRYRESSSLDSRPWTGRSQSSGSQSTRSAPAARTESPKENGPRFK